MRIFVTVGTQLPFDRLVAAVDGWAAEREAEIFAQTGNSAYEPQHIGWKNFTTSVEANEWIRSADLVVAHAGMGTILTRCETGLPIIVMPRRADLGEHRNDHQSATAKRLSHLPGLTVVENETELRVQLSSFKPPGNARQMGAVASASLLLAIRDFVSEPSRH